MDKNEKDTLDTYRQDRKERISKQSKKSGKKSGSHDGAKMVAEKIFGIVVCVVVVVALLASSLNFFGVPQRVLKAVTIDGKSYSMSELSCYYMQMYNNIYQYAYTYDTQYGSGFGAQLTGYDISIPPTQQTRKDDDGNEITWDEYFLDEAIESMANVKRYYNAAVKAGIELSDEDKQEVQDAIDKIETSLKNSADSNMGNYSVSRYITLTYGKGVTTSLFKKILTEQKMVEIYQEYRQDELKSAYSDTDIEAVYDEDNTKYDVVTVRWYTIDVTSETKKAESASGAEDTSEAASAPIAEEYQAQALINKIKSEQNYNEETFKTAVLADVGTDSKNYETYQDDNATLLQKISKSAISSNVSAAAADWLYEQDDSGNYVRQPGDMNYFLNSDGDVVYIFYATGTPFRDTTVPASVRHILVKFPEEDASAEDSTDNDAAAADAEVSADVKAECASEAESILNVYKDYIEENENGEADEDYFAELASKYSDDTGSQSTGGLIENMQNNGSYVKNFEDWAFAEGEYEGESRAEGDTGIIETEFGYHVMYFVGGHDHPDWYETILNDLISEDWEAEQTKFDESFGEDAIARKEFFANQVKKDCIKKIGG